FLVSLLLSTTFSFAGAVTFLKPHFRFVSNLSERWSNWQEERARQKALQKPDTKKEKTLKKQTIVTEKPRHIEEPAALLDEPEYQVEPKPRMEALVAAPTRPIAAPRRKAFAGTTQTEFPPTSLLRAAAAPFSVDENELR